MATAKATARTTKKASTSTTSTETKKRSDLVYKCGNVGSDPELRFTPGGKAVVNFDIAVNRKDGEDVITEWYRVTAWEQLAENVAASVLKGTRVMVWGVPSIEDYEANDGITKKQKKINAWNVGAELSFATADVSKIERNSDYSNQEADF